MSEHLRTTHDFKDDVLIKRTVRMYEIGKDFQKAYWCGFCQSIQQTQKHGPQARDERYTHIDRHFTKDKLNILQWIDVETGRSKEDSDVEDKRSEASRSEGPAGPSVQRQSRMNGRAMYAGNKRSRNEEDPPSPKRSRTEEVPICCVSLLSDIEAS
jgi:hypothetical protein